MNRASSDEYEIEVGLLTDTGKVRTRNEDSIVFIRPRSLDLKTKGVLAIVADGMGGHSGGNVASRMAIELISSEYYQNDTDQPLEGLKQAFHKANAIIYEHSLSDSDLNGMGTTATALLLNDARACFVHVGDSRLYRLHGNELSQITEDQTLAMALLKDGVIDKAQAESFPEKNIITNALGSKPALLDMEAMKEIAFSHGDQFLLCSDGLYDLVAAEEIREQMMIVQPPQAACERLVDLAKKRGGHDNASLIILKIVPVGKENRTVRVTRC